MPIAVVRASDETFLCYSYQKKKKGKRREKVLPSSLDHNMMNWRDLNSKSISFIQRKREKRDVN